MGSALATTESPAGAIPTGGISEPVSSSSTDEPQMRDIKREGRSPSKGRGKKRKQRSDVKEDFPEVVLNRPLQPSPVTITPAMKTITLYGLKNAYRRIHPYAIFASQVLSYLPATCSIYDYVYIDTRRQNILQTLMSDNENEVLRHFEEMASSEMRGHARRAAPMAEDLSAVFRDFYDLTKSEIQQGTEAGLFAKQLVDMTKSMIDQQKELTQQLTRLNDLTAAAKSTPLKMSPSSSSGITPPPSTPTSPASTAPGSPTEPLKIEIRPKVEYPAVMPTYPESYRPFPPSSRMRDYPPESLYVPRVALRPQFLANIYNYMQMMNTHLGRKITLESVVESGNETAISMLAKLIGSSLKFHKHTTHPSQSHIDEYQREVADVYAWFRDNYAKVSVPSPITIGQLTGMPTAPVARVCQPRQIMIGLTPSHKLIYERDKREMESQLGEELTDGYLEDIAAAVKRSY